MIYIIGGAPRSGKSILSKRLSRKIKVPYLPTDNIRPILIPYFKGKKLKAKFPFQSMFDAAAIDEFFLLYSGQEQLNADLKEAKTTWPGIKSLIDHLLVCKTEYIIEGIHLLPSLVKEYKNNDNVKIAFLAKLDEEKIFRDFVKNKNNTDWLIDNIRDGNTIRLAAKAMNAYGSYFKREAKKYGFNIFNTEDSFSQQINQAIHYFTT